ncbi:MAG: hypothetical protein WBE34_12175, partial [Candidatus Nitrosopolaris sp.]
GVKRLVEDALWTQGLRRKLDQNKKRHEFQTDHGFRKFFKTRCELSKVNSLHIEILMNHSTGISEGERSGIDKPLYNCERVIFDSLVTGDGHTNSCRMRYRLPAINL